MQQKFGSDRSAIVTPGSYFHLALLGSGSSASTQCLHEGQIARLIFNLQLKATFS